MNLPSAHELAKFFVGQAEKSAKDRMNFYFNQFWEYVAEQNGFCYTAEFPEGSDLEQAHSAAFAQLIRDMS